MIEITILGSSGSSPAKDRNLPSVALRREGDVFLFDCGEGTQMQMIKYGINAYRIKAIFVSHSHGDHIIGIAGLVRTLAMSNRDKPLGIFVPKGQEKIIKALVMFDKAMIGYDINIIGIGKGLAYTGKDFRISAFRLNHTINALGYIFQENDKKNFIMERCKKLGIEGRMFSELQKNGRIKLGKRIIYAKDLLEVKPGKKIVYAMDTRPTAETVKAAKDADLLIHESSYTEEFGRLARERKHSTALEAAEIAKKANVKRLVLTHISTRFKTAKPLIDEARKVFKEVSVAEDGERIIV
jgi:ribonuclease Z